jgi:monoamine oxidase
MGKTKEIKSIDVDYCIAGAGYAGLTAAYRLKQAGHSVAVLEARNRIGGRVHTLYLDDGTPIDLGGTFVGAQHERLYALIAEMGCETIPTNKAGGDTMLVYKGEVQRYKGLVADIGIVSLVSVWAAMQMLNYMSKDVPPEAPWNAPKAKEWDAMTLAQWIDNPFNLPTEESRTMMRSVIGGMFTSDASEVSFLNVLFHIAAGDNQVELQFKVEGGAEQDMVKGGMQTIANKVAEKLGDAVYLETPVRKINHNANGVEVISDKVIVNAKRVIMSVPPNLADHIEFTPQLPAARAKLLPRMTLGSGIRVLTVFEEPFWLKDGLSGECIAIDHTVSLSIDTSQPGKAGVLASYAFGPAAVEISQLSAEERKKIFIDALVHRFGPKAASPLHYIEFDWSEEPWTRGAMMAHYAPGVITNFGHVVRDPVGRIHWATTETSTKWNGFIEGAIRSGERAAKEVTEAE